MWVPSLGQEEPLEWELATHSSGLEKVHAWKKFMNRGAWQITVPRVAKSWT